MPSGHDRPHGRTVPHGRRIAYNQKQTSARFTKVEARSKLEARIEFKRMSHLQGLIQELCPQGVPFAQLEDVGAFYGGLTGKSKNDFNDGNAKFVPYKNIFDNLEVDFQALESVKVSKNENQHEIQLGDVLFTGSSETPNECGMSSVVTIQPTEKTFLNSFSFGVRLNDTSLLIPGFSKHLFRSN